LICYDFDKKAATIFGKIKNTNKITGKTIEDMDVMVASICIANDLILVTNNTKHFEHIIELKIEDWTKNE
jgi:tRNA(fMet)-specific endonuclease VapC